MGSHAAEANADLVTAAIVCAGALAVAQNQRPEIRLKADTGIVAKADAMTKQALDGNVRMTLPAPK